MDKKWRDWREYRYLMKWVREVFLYSLSFLLIAGVAFSISFALKQMYPEGETGGFYYQILTFAKQALFLIDVLLFLIFLGMSSVGFIANAARDVLPSNMRALVASIFAKNPTASSGVIHISRRMATEDVVKMIENATEEIDIVQTWLANESDILPSLLEAANNGCKVKILLLCTEPPLLSECRAAAIGWEKDKGMVKSKIDESLRNIRCEWAKSGSPENFEVRQYWIAPSVFLYRVDNKLYFGPYLADQQGIAGMTFVADAASGFIHEQVIKKHFAALWSRLSVEYPLGDPKEPA